MKNLNPDNKTTVRKARVVKHFVVFIFLGFTMRKNFRNPTKVGILLPVDITQVWR